MTVTTTAPALTHSRYTPAFSCPRTEVNNLTASEPRLRRLPLSVIHSRSHWPKAPFTYLHHWYDDIPFVGSSECSERGVVSGVIRIQLLGGNEQLIRWIGLLR